MWLAPRSTSAGARAFAAASLSITALLVVEVGAFASMQSFRIEERNDFYVAPFALIALLGLAARDDVVTGARAACALAAALVAGVLPFARAVRAVRQLVGRLRHLRPPAVVVAAGSGHPLPLAAPRRARRRARGRLRFVLAAALARASFPCAGRRLLRARLRRSSRTAGTGSTRRPPAACSPASACRIRTGSTGASAATPTSSFVWHYAGETRPLWNNEFFNRSVGTVYTRRRPRPGRRRPAGDARARAARRQARDRAGAIPRVRYAVSLHRHRGYGGWPATPASASRSTGSTARS